MSARSTGTGDTQLLRDLVSGLTLPGARSPLSVGLVGHPEHPPQPPAHCLRACLGGDPEALEQRGCPFLVRAARGRLDMTCLEGGYCRQGYRVVGQMALLGGDSAVMVSVSSGGPELAGAGEHGVLLGHLDAVARLVQRIGQVVEENAGFADEVLKNYEQLNLIFDLIPQIAQTQETRAMEVLVLQRVARLLNAQSIGVISPEDDLSWQAADGTPIQDETLIPRLEARFVGEIVRTVRINRHVHVASVPGYQVLAGPLVHLDDRVFVVLAARTQEKSPFMSGDMMLIESMLAFGGQIISNNELQERLRSMSMEVTRALVAAIDKKDHYTSGHSERGGFLTRLTAEQFGLPPAEQQIMEWAGLLHDVGKIGISDEILCKPGKLTPEEYEVIKQHPRMGYEILKPIGSFGLVLDGVLYHHEHPDGSGYPEGLKGDEIPLVARIIHVVDTFDALTSTRAYRKAFTIEKAMEIIREETGTRIDPEAARAFFTAFEKYRQEWPEDYAARFLSHQERTHERA